MSPDLPREEELLAVAAGLPGPAQRAAYLDQACGGDAALRARVETLLRSHLETRSVPGGTPSCPPAPATPDGVVLERPGSRIGPYTLLGVLGEGGMGTVYMAEQTHPVKRRVALKIIKPGMDSRQVIARFEAERQALALMDHPNIAKVLDAGATENGRPYFVMELVQGTPITRYCDEHQLSPRRRLELFKPVCAAINHAHQKGIIHRDIKPSNVLVAVYDGQPTVKVIDFGIAKAIGRPLTEETLQTGLGGIVGTLQYMSPEQAELDAVDIDTRSDVYGLGVLLYELLTGTTPITRQQFERAAVTELLRMIREETPPRPSKRLEDTRDALPSIAALRHSEPATLTRVVRGDLDWIVMKSLEKDRRRRYDSASGFARDIERYLNREPVEARPPSAGYLLHKFVQRNRHLVSALAMVFLVLVIAVAATAYGMITARRAEREERIAKEEARAAARDARAVLQFFERRVLAAARPKGQIGGLGRDATIRDAISAAEPAIEAEFSATPAVEASIRNTAGQTYMYLAEWERAISHFRRSLQLFQESRGNEHRDTLYAQGNLGLAHAQAGQLAEAQQILERTLEARRRTLGSGDPDTLLSINNLGMLYSEMNRYAQALPLLEEAVQAYREQGIADDQALSARNNLGLALQQMGRPSEALPHFEAVLEERKRTLGLEHPNTLGSMVNLSSAYRDVGRLDEAIKLAEETRQKAVDSLTVDHPFTMAAMNCLFVAYSAAARYDEAARIGAETLGLVEPRLGPRHPNTQKVRLSLATVHLRRGSWEEAVRLAEIARPNLPAGSPDLEVAGQILGEAWLMTKKTEKAIEVLGGPESARGPGEAKAGKMEKPWTICLFAAALAEGGKLDEAEHILPKAHAGLVEAAATPLPENRRRVRWSLERLVRLYEARGNPAEAARWREQLEAVKKAP